MPLSLQARLTLWYVATLVVCLSASGLEVAWLRHRLDIRRFEDGLVQAAATIHTALDAEINEGQTLPDAVIDTQRELIIPGCEFIMGDEHGALLASRVQRLPAVTLVASPDGVSSFSTPDGARWRRYAELHTHRAITYRVVVAKSLSSVDADAALLRDALWLGVPFAVLIAGAGGWWIARQGLRPISVLAEDAGRMSGREAGVRLRRPRGHDEIGRLADAFNALLGRLEQALTLQRDFMTDASHELRTPVSVIRSAAEAAMSRPARPEEEYRETLSIVREQAQRLGRLVDDMFLLTRADAGARPLMRTRFYLDELVHECVRAARILATGRGILVSETLESDVETSADEDLVRRLVMNLLGNAVRHTLDGQTVSVILRRSASELIIDVSDHGCGIDAADRERIFERFVRLPASGSADGGGLGLPIARWIAEAHGGTLQLLSSSATGSTFRITLPAA